MSAELVSKLALEAIFQVGEVPSDSITPRGGAINVTEQTMSVGCADQIGALRLQHSIHLLQGALREWNVLERVKGVNEVEGFVLKIHLTSIHGI
jgi:hypothetical protein